MKHLLHYVLPLSVLLLAGAPLHSQAAEFNQVRTDQSTLTFAYRQMGVPMEGKFQKFVAGIAFDPAKADTAQARIEVDLASIDTGFSDGDKEVLGKQWFNAQAYPAARFVSTGVKTLGGNRYEVLGALTLKGKTQQVSAPFTFKPEGASAVFDGTFTLKRLDYAIGEGAWADTSAVANEVQVRFHIVADAAPAKK